VTDERRTKPGKDAAGLRGSATQAGEDAAWRGFAAVRRVPNRPKPTHKKMRLAETLGCLPCA